MKLFGLCHNFNPTGPRHPPTLPQKKTPVHKRSYTFTCSAFFGFQGRIKGKVYVSTVSEVGLGVQVWTRAGSACLNCLGGVAMNTGLGSRYGFICYATAAAPAATSNEQRATSNKQHNKQRATSSKQQATATDRVVKRTIP
mmetsp:Transcript_1277/g.2595  ORF Transcript_1277/g.2595 Transcript_1277/m.2595 type:complete len:141 (-) Transcript_1277:127-549(-)